LPARPRVEQHDGALHFGGACLQFIEIAHHDHRCGQSARRGRAGTAQGGEHHALGNVGGAAGVIDQFPLLFAAHPVRYLDRLQGDLGAERAHGGGHLFDGGGATGRTGQARPDQVGHVFQALVGPVALHGCVTDFAQGRRVIRAGGTCGAGEACAQQADKQGRKCGLAEVHAFPVRRLSFARNLKQ
jgi:hypothetical protein